MPPPQLILELILYSGPRSLTPSESWLQPQTLRGKNKDSISLSSDLASHRPPPTPILVSLTRLLMQKPPRAEDSSSKSLLSNPSSVQALTSSQVLVWNS